MFLYIGFWTQAIGNHTYTDTMPSDLDGLTVEGATDLDGTIYFEASHYGTDGRPGTTGNYLLELDTATNQLTADRVPFFGMSYERHTDNLLSFYEIDAQTVEGQANLKYWSGIPTQNGGYYVLLNSSRQRITTIKDTRGLDLHELTITPDGNYIYMITDQRLLYEDHTITCLWACQMFGQSIVEVTPDGTELYRYDLLDFYDRDSFTITHANSIYLHEDMLIVSIRHTNEIIAISRTDGSLIWRTGEMTFINDDGFTHQHDATITPDGTLLLFDNGNGKEREMSRVVEYQINSTALEKVWEYSNGHFQPNRGSARRLPDGSTLINFVTHIEIVKDDRPTLTITLPDFYTSYQADYWSNEP